MKRAPRPRPRSPIPIRRLDRGDHGRRRIQRARSGRAFAHCQGRAELFLLLRHGKDLREQQGGVLRAVHYGYHSVPLPAHTGLDINVDVTDLQTTIPYTGAVRIKYKTMLLSVTGYHRTKGSIDSWKGRDFKQYTFGRNGSARSRIWMPASRTGMSPATTPTVWI